MRCSLVIDLLFKDSRVQKGFTQKYFIEKHHIIDVLMCMVYTQPDKNMEVGYVIELRTHGGKQDGSLDNAFVYSSGYKYMS